MRFLHKNARPIFAVIVIGFLALTILVLVFPSSWVDLEFSEEIQEHHNHFLDFLMKAISWFGLMYSSIITVTVSAIILFVAKKRRAAFFSFSTLLIGLIIYLIKILVNRPRPGKGIVRVIVDAQHQSFPSGHVAFYIAFFGFVAFILHHHKWLTKTFRYLIICFCCFLILTIPISRVYLGVHWFTDILGGFLLGVLFLWIHIILYLKNQNQ
ncbi:membrane-associated phospholipid phosphatase [Pedobacter sp. UYP30]|uniref:phosphatase PAP2 family protein n=1 Tax=Pedobacter sp. UYP30 TaxID=1756400 RepID=UPI003395D234